MSPAAPPGSSTTLAPRIRPPDRTAVLPTVRALGPGGLARPRLAVARQATRLARLACATAILLSPTRAAVDLIARPMAPIYVGYTDVFIPWSGLAVVVTIGLWLCSLAAAPRAVSLGPAFLRWPLGILLALAWIGVPWSMDPVISTYNALEITALAAFAVYVANEVGSLGGVVLPIAIMVTVQAVVAIGQLVVQRSVGLGFLGELDLNPMTNGVSVAATSTSDRLLRGYGLTEHPNILGGLLAFALPVLVANLDQAGRFGRWRVIVIVALGAVALLATFSRAAWLALAIAIGLGVAMLLVGRQRAALRAWVTVAFVIVGLSVPFLVGYGRFVAVRAAVLDPTVATEAMSIGERSILIGAAANVVAAHPLLGTGLGTLPQALHAADPRATFDVQPAPVVMLDVAAEIGLLGALSYGVALVAPWLALWFRRRQWTRELVAVSASLAGLTVVGLFDYYPWTFAPGRIWAWLIIGLWAGAYARATASHVRA